MNDCRAIAVLSQCFSLRFSTKRSTRFMGSSIKSAHECVFTKSLVCSLILLCALHPSTYSFIQNFLIHSFTLLIFDIFIQSFVHPFDLNSQFSLSFARSLGSTIGSFVRILIC